MCALKVTHGTKRVEIDFPVFSTILEYTEANAERCQAQIFIQTLEFYDSQTVIENRSKSSQQQEVSKV